MRSRLYLAMLVLTLGTKASFGAPVPLSADAALQRATEILVSMEAIPSFRDKELRILKTDPVPTKLSMVQADCGKQFGIAYLRDKRVKTAVTYQVFVKPIDESSSDVTVRVSIDGYMDTNEGAPFFVEKTKDNNKTLMCKSTGQLEDSFFERMR